ncbi:MAG: hypothetical protein KJ052_17915 [Candidatus Hydrogenedentes bacterium]|nr:hypothetical protein [Anaerolineales bacterium]MCL4218863.1 hypothetical protein [Candidatus Hydrogenedentota bacterium]
MATSKKSQSKAPAAKASTTSSDNSMEMAWKWLYVGGILVASLLGALRAIGVFGNADLSWLAIVFAVIGFLVGLFYFDSSDLMNFGLRFLIVSAAAPSLNVIPVVGLFLTGFFTSFAAFLGPVVLGMVIVYFWKKYFGSM